LIWATLTLAQGSYPDRAIRILVGFPAGGPPDIAARLLAERFAASWGKSVVVENATGGGGISQSSARPKPRPTATRC
jgi:tripartite-type tricarboxylate transporter receptor subunit TctC